MRVGREKSATGTTVAGISMNEVNYLLSNPFSLMFFAGKIGGDNGDTFKQQSRLHKKKKIIGF